LCGRIVCFLPPTPPTPPPLPPPQKNTGTGVEGEQEEKEKENKKAVPTRRERCSTFFTYVVDADDASTSSSSTTIDKTGRGGVGGNEKAKTLRRRKGLIVELKPIEQDPNLTVEQLLNGIMSTDGGDSVKSGTIQQKKDRERHEKKKDDRKKVRVCRECLDTVLYVSPPPRSLVLLLSVWRKTDESARI
jgi:hypothetical protein